MSESAASTGLLSPEGSAAIFSSCERSKRSIKSTEAKKNGFNGSSSSGRYISIAPKPKEKLFCGVKDGETVCGLLRRAFFGATATSARSALAEGTCCYSLAAAAPSST